MTVTGNGPSPFLGEGFSFSVCKYPRRRHPTDLRGADLGILGLLPFSVPNIKTRRDHDQTANKGG